VKAHAPGLENYFNYFTEIEECFRRYRGMPSLLSTLDWALIEAWKEAEIPLEAVLSGIERSFAKFAKRPRRFQRINSLAYCSQEVLRAAEEMRTAAVQGDARGAARSGAEPAFPPEMVSDFLRRNAQATQSAANRAQAQAQAVLSGDLKECAAGISEIVAAYEAQPAADLEELERRLTAIEDKAAAAMTRASSAELLTGLRSEVDRELATARRKMTATQIEAIERQYLKKRLFEHYQVPRLSLFYL
jgi:hypothetical protein